MKLLDDTFKPSAELNKEDIAEVYRLRQEHSKLKKEIHGAKIAITIISILSAISFLVSLARDSEYLEAIDIFTSLGLIVVYGICASVDYKYSKYSISIALGLYILNLLLLFFINPTFASLSIIIKGFFIYFMSVGLLAALKYNGVLDKMEHLNIKPYTY